VISDRIEGHRQPAIAAVALRSDGKHFRVESQ